MRSINYLIHGAPMCFADCIDHMEKHSVRSVSLELRYECVVREYFPILRLYGVFTWDFDSGVVVYEEQFGGIVQDEPEARRMKSVDNANRRVLRRVEDFRGFSLDLMGADQRFPYEVINRNCSGNL